MQEDRATAVANAFKSKNPFFVHAMKASHIVGGGWPNVVSYKMIYMYESQINIFTGSKMYPKFFGTYILL